MILCQLSLSVVILCQLSLSVVILCQLSLSVVILCHHCRCPLDIYRIDKTLIITVCCDIVSIITVCCDIVSIITVCCDSVPSLSLLLALALKIAQDFCKPNVFFRSVLLSVLLFSGGIHVGLFCLRVL